MVFHELILEMSVFCKMITAFLDCSNCRLKFKQALQGQMYSFEKMKNLFERAGAPYDPTHIGLTRAQLKAMFPVVQLMRFRYNVLDLAKRGGFYDNLVEPVFASGGSLEI